jgi:hypothetical protein
MWTSRRFLIAIAGLMALAFAAWRTLDGEMLWFTWFILGICAIKTVVIVLRSRFD